MNNTALRDLDFEGTIWNIWQKFIFRIAFVFFPSFCFFHANVFEFNFLFEVQLYFSKILQPVINLLGKNIFAIHDEKALQWRGGGDTLADYLLVLSLVILSIVISWLWAYLDKNKKNYHKLYVLLRIIVRYYLAIVLMQYGLAKIIKTQFPFPGLATLTNTYGNASPMNLAWTFFGFSEGYNVLLGVFELLAMLLIYKRTETLGALITFGVTINIMAINYFYDVPVKILSTTLVGMCLFLLLPNVKKLWSYFVLNRPSKLIVFNSTILFQLPVKAVLWGKIVLVTVVFFITAKHIRNRQMIIGDNAVKTPLYGIYEVETFIINTDTLPPLLTDKIRWKQLVVNWPGNARIQLMNNSFYYEAFNVDTVKKKIILGYENGSPLNYQIPDSETLIIDGKLNGDSVYVEFNKVNPQSFKLINRGFHWVSEVPFNE